MAFIVCATCGGQVSDTAPECPDCGMPTGFAPPERPKYGRYALVVAGVVLAAGIIVLIARQFGSEPVAKAPQQEVAKPPPQEVAKAPQQEVMKPPPQEATAEPRAAKNGVYFLAVYTSSGDGRELLRELRPVVAQDESAMNEVMNAAASGLALRPLGLKCGPEREPYFAWVSSRDATPQPHVRVGGTCGYASLTEAAQKAMEFCRQKGGCQRTDAEIQLYAADVRDGAEEAWRPKPRIWCHFTAGSIVNAWQYGPQKSDFNSGCESLLSQ